MPPSSARPMAGRLGGQPRAEGRQGRAGGAGGCRPHAADASMTAVRRDAVRFHGIGMPPGEAAYFKLTLFREGQFNPRRMRGARELKPAMRRYEMGTGRKKALPGQAGPFCVVLKRAGGGGVPRPAYFGGVGVNPSRLRPGSGLGLGFGAFFASFLPLSLLPMGASVTQKARGGKGKNTDTALLPMNGGRSRAVVSNPSQKARRMGHGA